MYYELDSDGKIIGAYNRPQSFETVFIEADPENMYSIWNGGEWVSGSDNTVYPTEAILKDIATGEPVKVVVENGQVYVGALDD